MNAEIMQRTRTVREPRSRSRIALVAITTIVGVISLIVEARTNIFESFNNVHWHWLWYVVYAAMLVGYVVVEQAIARDQAASEIEAMVAGAIAGTASVFAVAFAMTIPMSIIGLVANGIGFCGLSPYFSLSHSRFEYAWLISEGNTPDRPGSLGRCYWIAFAINVALLIGLWVVSPLTLFKLGM